MALITGWFIVHQKSGVTKNADTGELAFFTEITYSNGTEFRYGRFVTVTGTSEITGAQVAALEDEAADNAGVLAP